MRIRILRDISLSGSPGIRWTVGSVADVSPDIADKWIKQGVAMEDKTIDPQEIKQDKIRKQTAERVRRFRENKAK